MNKVEAPKGAQLLIYPMIECTIAAGFKNAKYKNHYGYIHYGIDFDFKRAVDFDVLASGDGVVLGTEKNNNSIGGVVVIRYDNVSTEKYKSVFSLISTILLQI